MPVPVISATQARSPAEAEIPSSPEASEAAGGCYYVWATRELPLLSKKLEGALAAVGGDYLASAYAFGEDCHHIDGTTTFLPMETDFRVRVAADSLSDKAALGTAISKVMRVVEALPMDEVPGTRPGRVEFEFYGGSTGSLRLSIEISRFLAEAEDLQGSALFEHFLSAP